MLFRSVGYENTPMGSFQAALCWMTPQYLLDDLRDFLGGVAAQVDGAVVDGGTEDARRASIAAHGH